MTLRVYNTLTREKSAFNPIEEGKVRMYVCGPTVYDSAHVGHAMSSIVFDVIRRYLEYRGFQVRHVMNYTDVDDKVIKRANELGVDPVDLAAEYVEQYDKHLQDLNVMLPTVKPRVSQEIEGIGHGATDSIRARLYDLQVQEKELASKYTENYPLLQQIRQQVAEATEVHSGEDPTRRHVTTAPGQAYQAGELAVNARSFSTMRC